MNLEKKAVIIGAIWGLISSIFWIIGSYIAFGHGNPTATLSGKFLLYVIGFPTYISSSVIDYLGLLVPLYTLIFIVPIPIGALIGYGIAKIYLKVKK